MYEILQTAEVTDYLDSLNPIDHKSALTAVKALEMIGPDLRRPFSEYLRDGIFELRARKHRILYRRHGSKFTLLTGFFKKGRKVPDKEIEKAVEIKKQISC